jgi:hypothetical protein
LQDDKPVAYESRKLKPAECNYATHEREMLAAVHCLRTWRCYLDGFAPFKLCTDHKPLLLFDDQPRISSRQARWLQFFSMFDFEWHYTKGKDNPADFLTRMPMRQAVLHVLTRSQQKQQDSLSAGGEEPRHVPKRLRDEIPTAQVPKKTKVMQSPECDRPKPQLERAIADAMLKDSWFANTENLKALVCQDGLYYLNGKLVIPADAKLRLSLIAEYHNPPARGHPGIARTAEHLLREVLVAFPGKRCEGLCPEVCRVPKEQVQEQ